MWRRPVRSATWEAKVFRGLFSTAQSANTVNASCSSVSGKKWRRPSGFDTGLKTFNSLTKQKEPLILAREGVATWYGVSFSDYC